MNNKPHLLEVSKEEFDDALEFEKSDPQKSMKYTISGHEILASYYLANHNELFIDELEITTKLKLNYINTYSEKLWPESQINYTFLCLAINNIQRAMDFITIETDYKNSHKFAILLNCKLRELLGAPLLVAEPDYTPSKSEVGLFEAFDKILSKQEVSWDLLHKYWKATKKKRYELTVFEYDDLFSRALRNGEKAFNKRVN